MISAEASAETSAETSSSSAAAAAEEAAGSGTSRAVVVRLPNSMYEGAGADQGGAAENVYDMSAPGAKSSNRNQIGGGGVAGAPVVYATYAADGGAGGGGESEYTMAGGYAAAFSHEVHGNGSSSIYAVYTESAGDGMLQGDPKLVARPLYDMASATTAKDRAAAAGGGAPDPLPTAARGRGRAHTVFSIPFEDTDGSGIVNNIVVETNPNAAPAYSYGGISEPIVQQQQHQQENERGRKQTTKAASTSTPTTKVSSRARGGATRKNEVDASDA